MKEVCTHLLTYCGICALIRAMNIIKLTTFRGAGGCNYANSKAHAQKMTLPRMRTIKYKVVGTNPAVSDYVHCMKIHTYVNNT